MSNKKTIPVKVETKSAEVVVEKAAEVVVETAPAGDIAVFPATENVAESATEKFGDEAKVLFAEYPENEAFHFTSDGLAFFQHGDARNHATTLEDKEVVTKTRKPIAPKGE